MPLPGHPPLCPHPLPIAVDLKIRIPGGGTIQVPAVGLPHPGDQVAKLLGILSAALAPLMPLFDLVDAMMTIVKVFKAVATLSPLSITLALGDLILIIDRLKLLLPQVSVPALLVDVLVTLRVYVDDLVLQLEALVAQQLRIQAAEEKAALFVELQAHVTCARVTVEASFASMKSGAAPVNRLLRVVNLVAAAAGLPAVPAIDFSVDPAGALAPLRSLSVTLKSLESAIPV